MKTNGINKPSYSYAPIVKDQNRPYFNKAVLTNKDKFAGTEKSHEFIKNISPQKLTEQDFFIDVSCKPRSCPSIPWWSLEREIALSRFPSAGINFNPANLQLLARLKELATDKSYLNVKLFDLKQF